MRKVLQSARTGLQLELWVQGVQEVLRLQAMPKVQKRRFVRLWSRQLHGNDPHTIRVSELVLWLQSRLLQVSRAFQVVLKSWLKALFQSTKRYQKSRPSIRPTESVQTSRVRCRRSGKPDNQVKRWEKPIVRTETSSHTNWTYSEMWWKFGP